MTQEKPNIDRTKVWKVNKELVVADTIQEAIETFRESCEYPNNEVTFVELYEYCSNSNALIKR